MKTIKLNSILAALVAAPVLVFVVCAIVHIVHLTQLGLIHWNY